MNRAEVIEFMGSLYNEEDHKFEDDGNEQRETINICDEGNTFLVWVRNLFTLKEWRVCVTKELRGDAFARHVGEAAGDPNVGLIYEGRLIRGERTLEEYGITLPVLVFLWDSEPRPGVEIPSESSSEGEGSTSSTDDTRR